MTIGAIGAKNNNVECLPNRPKGFPFNAFVFRFEYISESFAVFFSAIDKFPEKMSNYGDKFCNIL